MSSITRTRCLVELQGYLALSDREIREIDPWLRVAPAVCAVWALVASLSGATPALNLLAMIAGLGAAMPWHPFDLPYNLVIHHWMGTAPIPRSRMPRRFACGVATCWLSLTATATAAGASGLGAALGVAFALVALAPVTTGLCIASWVLSRFGRRTRCAVAGRSGARMRTG